MPKTLRIAAWNANGIIQHVQEIRMFLEHQKLDICLISETHATDQTYVKIKGYKIYHTPHPDDKCRGGSAVIVKDNIKHHEKSKYATREIQSTEVNILTKGGYISIAAIYCPPRYKMRYEEYLKFLRTLGYHFILYFNAKNTYWGSRMTRTEGRELYKAAKMLKCEFHSTGKPTYWPTDANKVPDLLDFFILKGISSNYISMEDCFDLSSDHSPIILTLSETIITKQKTQRLTNKNTDWNGYRIELEQQINLRIPLKNKEQLDIETENFTNIMQQAAWNNTPEMKVGIKGSNYPKEIREMLSEKRKARRKWQHSRSPENKNILNRISQRLKRTIQELKNETVGNYLKGLSNEKSTEYSLWRATKYLKKTNSHSPPIKKEDGTWAASDIQKAKLFAEHMANTFKPHAPQTTQEIINTTRNADKTKIKLTTPNEVATEIRTNINPKKTPGYDQISGIMLKELPRKGIVMLTYLINAAIRLEYVPAQWKVAEIIMIPKPGKSPNEKTSYRPISLLPTISKLFEKIVLKRLKLIIEERKLLPSHQFGFRNKHSTMDQVHRITDIIENTLEEKKVCATIFLDVAQAFDKVWHRGLQYKLEKYLPWHYSQLLKSYMAERHFRIKYEDEYSELKRVEAGVPQGSVLGPILYLLYTRDIPVSDEVTIATFADDTAIMAVGEDVQETTERLQSAINQINGWTKRWRIKLNESKSTHINFTNRRMNPVPITINQKVIPYENNAKYLGMTLDAKLRWKVHVKKKKEEMNIKFRKMYWLLGKQSELSIHNKLILYNQILKPIWTYGAQLWGCTKESNIKIIQTFQNKVLRCIVNAPWYIRNKDIHRDLKIPMVAEEIHKFAAKHRQRLQNHQNQLMPQLLEYTGLRKLKRTKPRDLVQ